MFNAVRTIIGRCSTRGPLMWQVRTTCSGGGSSFEKYLSPKEIHEYTVRFDRYDVDRNAMLSPVEFNDWVRDEVGRTYNAVDLDVVFEIVDTNCDGQVSSDELLNHIAKRYHKKYSREEFIKAFERFDKNNDGRMNCTEIRQALIMLGQPGGHPALEKVVQQVDSDCDGMITYEEFKDLVENHLPNIGNC